MLRYTTKERLEPVDLLLNISWKLTLSVGALVLICYCALEGVIPDGVTAGDALLLVFSVLSFGAILAVGTFYGALSTLWLLRAILAIGNSILKRRGRPTASLHKALDSWFVWGAVSGLCFVVFAVMFYVIWVNGNRRMVDIIVFFPLAGFLMVCFFGTVPPDGKRMGWRMATVAFVAAFYVASNFGRAPLLDLTMGVLGVRTLPNDALIVGKDYRDRMESWATLYGIPLQSCAIAGANQWLLQNAVGVWHGIGATSYVRISATSGDAKSLLIPVAAKDLTVLRQRKAAYRCDEKMGPSHREGPELP